MYIILLDKYTQSRGTIKHWEMVQYYDDVIEYLNPWINDGWSYKVYHQGERVSI